VRRERWKVARAVARRFSSCSSSRQSYVCLFPFFFFVHCFFSFPSYGMLGQRGQRGVGGGEGGACARGDGERGEMLFDVVLVKMHKKMEVEADAHVPPTTCRAAPPWCVAVCLLAW